VSTTPIMDFSPVPGAVIDGRERVEDERGTAFVRDRAEIERMHLAQPKRLPDRERAVPELRLGREQLDRDEPLCQPAEREQRFERCHASAGDYDAKRLAAHVTLTVKRRTLSSPIVFIAMPG